MGGRRRHRDGQEDGGEGHLEGTDSHHEVSSNQLQAQRRTGREEFPGDQLLLLRVSPPLQVGDSPVVLYHGPVRPLCPLAPNNVNTMAAAAVAASNLGFDGTVGRLVSDPTTPDWHCIEVTDRVPPVRVAVSEYHVLLFISLLLLFSLSTSVSNCLCCLGGGGGTGGAGGEQVWCQDGQWRRGRRRLEQE